MFKNKIKIAFSIKNPPALLDAENKPNPIINQLIPSMKISSMILIESLMDLHWKYHVIHTVMQTNYSRILRLLDFLLDIGVLDVQKAQPQKDLDYSKQPRYPLPDLLSAFHLQCVHPLLHDVLNSSLMACEWTRSEQGRPGAFSTRGIFSHTNQLAYYFFGSQDL